MQPNLLDVTNEIFTQVEIVQEHAMRDSITIHGTNRNSVQRDLYRGSMNGSMSLSSILWRAVPATSRTGRMAPEKHTHHKIAHT